MCLHIVCVYVCDCACVGMHLCVCVDESLCGWYRYEYHWADGTTVKKPIKCSAPKYIDYLMTWVQEQLDDEAIFPSKIGMFTGQPCSLRYVVLYVGHTD